MPEGPVWELILYSNINFGRHVFWPIPPAPGLDWSATLFSFCIYCACGGKKEKKQDDLVCESINRSPPKNHYFSVLRSAERKSCRREQRRGKKCQCLKKESSLIESESTFASSWMSEGVIGDWLQIMNNYIKVGALLVHVCVCVAILPGTACSRRMRLPLTLCMFLYTNRCRGVCSLLRQPLSAVCVCDCVWAD